MTKRRLRLAILVPAFHRRPTEPFIPAWANLVSRLGEHHDVHVLPLRRPTGPPYSVFGATVHPGPFGDVRRRISPALWAEAVARVARIHRQRPVSIVYGLQAHESGLVAGLAGAALGVPSAVHVHGGELTWRPELGFGGQGDRLTRWQTRIALRQAAVATAGSTPVVDLAVDLAPCTPARWAPYGVGREFRPSETTRPGNGAGPRLVTVADLNSVKRHDHLLAAFRRVRGEHPAATLHLIGDGSERLRVLNAVRRLGLNESVVLAGRLPHGAMPELLSRYDAFVQASAFEAQGLALLEALAIGLPAASTQVGAAVDLSQKLGMAPGLHVARDWTVDALATAMLAAVETSRRPGATERLSAAVRRQYRLGASVARLEAILMDAAR